MAAAEAQPETTLAQLADRVERLEDELEDERERRRDLEDRVDDLEAENQRKTALVEALKKKVDGNTDRVTELQSRELEKGAHLQWENVDGIEGRLDVDGDRVERFEGDDATFARLPGEADPLERSGSSRLAQGDLLPIQQLSRMDDDMLASSGPLPTQLAAKAWRARENGELWNEGSGKVHEFVDASDLRAWIRREEQGVSEDYAKKLVSRTLDAMLDLTKNRVYVERRNRRKDGLQYKERRCVLPSDAEIPGEMNDGGE